MTASLLSVLKKSGPRGVLRAIRRKLFVPRVGEVDFGDLRTLEPVSRFFGFDRGTPVDRHYIEGFLASHVRLITGRCLEIADAEYTTRYGLGVSRSDVLHADDTSPAATIIGDLTDLTSVLDDTYDCVIATQTLQYIYDIRNAISELHRILRPGGSCLCTMSFCSQISRFDMDRWGDYWRMTSKAAQTLFEDAFPDGEVEVFSYGNVLSATALLQGLAAEELTAQELDYRDPDYEVIVAVRATKGARP